VGLVALRVLVVAIVVVALVLTAAWALQRRLIYLPSGGAVPAASEVIPGARDVEFRTSDGLELSAWFVPADASDRAVAGDTAAGITVLVAHGNAGDRAGRAPLAEALAERGLSVLLFDYRGYGGNAGEPTEEGLAADVRAARRFLVEDEGVPPDRLVYFGESLGAAVVVELATEHPPGGLVLRSPWVDLASTAREHYPFLPARLLLRDRYPLRDQIAGVEVPVTVVYGTEDSVVPAEQSRSVAEAAPGPLDEVAVEGADHNDPVLLHGGRLVDAVVRLAETVRSRQG
jgi:uncharacterized protein